MEKHLLSKSTFIRGVQCLKSLYLYKNRYFLRDRLSPEQMAKFKRGTDVGIFAQSLFLGGIDCKPKSPSQYRKSVEKTADVIRDKTADVIYEATFQYDRVLILLDILAKENGKWNAYEVKSSLKISETYLLDAALQYYVLVNSGIEIDKFFLVHLNSDYVFDENLEIDQLFTFEDVTTEIAEKQDFVRRQIAAEKEAIALKKSPPIAIGTHCNNPYPCDFIGLCWKKVPEKSVFDLVFLSEEDKFKLFHAGKKSISDLSAEDFQDDKIKGEILCRQQNKVFFHAEKFNEAISGLHSPVSFVGFLGNRIAIPKWKNNKPYDMVPVSMSVVGTNGKTNKSYFNSSPESCPDEEFIDFLKLNLEHAGAVIVFEKDRLVLQLQQLIRRNPDHEEFLNTCLEKIFGLKDLILDFTYFNPQFSGELDYLDLHKILPPEDNPIPEYSSDALAINVYLKQPASEMTSSEMIDLTFWRASLTKSFFDYLNNK
jgi:hypothetical protein